MMNVQCVISSLVIVSEILQTLACYNEMSHKLYKNCMIYNDSSMYEGEMCSCDGKTYPNEVYIHCLNYKKFKPIIIRHPGNCQPEDMKYPFNPIYKPVCGSDFQTYANIEALQSKAVLINSTELRKQYNGECIYIDPCWRGGIGNCPVCGTNGFTYENRDQVACLRCKENDVNILHNGGCTVPEVLRIVKDKATLNYLAHQRSEWNPVCGKDNKTYSNPFQFLNSNCSENDYYHMGECGSAYQVSCNLVKSGAAEYCPVCGNNGETYFSMHHLICSSVDQPYIAPKHPGNCTYLDDPCFSQGTDGQPYVCDAGSPVCGTDDNTYVTLRALLCVQKYTNPCLHFKHSGKCLSEEENFL